MNLKEALRGKLTKKELEFLVTSFDVVGDVAIIDVPDELVKKQGLIAKAIMDINKNIKVVAKRIGIHTGIYRKQELAVIGGENRLETEHKENGVRVKLNLAEVYYSARLANERMRIAKQVKKGEEVLVMFSGCAPYPLVIAKNTKAKEIYGVEINPSAHKYGLENVALNKLYNIKLILGDVRLVVPALNKKFDRIAMPLPLGGENFLDIALNSIKKKGIIHFYDFKDEGAFEISRKKVKDACAAAKKKFRILRTVKCGQIGPRLWRICVDFKVL